MPILIDYRRCDGSPDCPAAKWCASGALAYNHATGRIEYDRARCNDCGTCAHWCGPGAIYVAADDAELTFLRQELDRLEAEGAG